ncbi:MAG: EI24 domain-containing protein [Planctomycetes bacterium]|nr:EI24 domain-containing protein [Planctomycetota bacterium]
MNPLPCPRCGYPAADERVEHCAYCARVVEPSLGAPKVGTRADLLAGGQAFLRGLYFLGRTGGTKRWLVPPILATTTLFVATTYWLVTFVAGWVEALRADGAAELVFTPQWLADALEAVLKSATMWWLVSLGGHVVALAVGFLVALWAFSIVYEAACGPFLDVVHARIERAWFGADPRASWDASRGEVGAKAWVVRNLATVWTSVKASLLAALVLLLAFPLQFVPLVGGLLFAVCAGFATAVSLLDIPFSRREWSLAQRLRFVREHGGAVIAFGLVAGLVFVVPFIGPLVCVPAASVGGAWLVCRLDKKGLRSLDRALAPH